MVRALTQEEFLQKAEAIHGNKYDYSRVSYVRNRDYIEIICNKCKQVFKQKGYNHLNGKGCPYCAKNVQRRSQADFIQKAKGIHGDHYDYSAVEYYNNVTKVKIYCNTCKKYFYQTPKAHLKGHGCEICGITLNHEHLIKSTECFIEQAKKVHGDIYDYSETIYTRAYSKVKIFCKHCKRYFYQAAYSHLNGKGCNHCRRSLGEAFIQRFLTEHRIAYEREKYFKGCKNKGKLLFDFYLPAYNLCIEFQGQQHYEPHFFMALLKKSKEEAMEVLKAQQHRDQIKRDYCKNNGIKLLEIMYKDNIEKVLTDWYNSL